MTELTEAELDDLQHRFDGWPQVQRLIAAARKGIAEDRPGYIHASKRGERQCVPDDGGYYIPGTYMMSEREAIEAGFISYDKPCLGGYAEAKNNPGGNRQSGDVETLIERLEKKGGWLSMSEPFPDRLCEAAAAMLRSLHEENRKLWASNREYAEGIELYHAKLERARDALILCDCVLNGDDHSWNAAKEAVRATLEEIND